jgi:DnaK suppressor protein
MMDKALTHELRTWLEAEQERLRAEVDEMDTEGREALSDVSGENNYRDHMADQGTATFSRELDMTLEENVRESLTSVSSALKRMDEGTYGLCARCGAEIAGERLKAVPAATLCITCKADEESL